MAINQVRQSMTIVRNNSMPKAAAVSPVPTIAVYHMSAGMAINMARATTRKLALLCGKRFDSGENDPTSHPPSVSRQGNPSGRTLRLI